MDDLGAALLGRADQAPLDRHYRQNRIVHEAVGCLLGVVRSGNEKPFFGPEFVPPAGSPVADVLAGFLGREF